MAAYLVLVVNASSSTIGSLNDKVGQNQDASNAINGAKDVVNAVLSGAITGSVQVVVRDTDPSVSTHGSGSTSTTYNIS